MYNKVFPKIKNSKLLHFFKGMHFKDKLFLSFLVVSILPLTIVGLFSYYRSKQLLEEQAVMTTSQIVQKGELNLAKRLGQIEEISNMIANNSEIQKTIIGSSQKHFYFQMKDYKFIKNYIEGIEKNFKIFRIRMYIDPPTVYVNDMVNIYALDRLKKENYSEWNQATGDKLYWKSTYTQAYLFQKEYRIISAYRVLKKLKPNNEIYLVYYVDILEEELSKILESIDINLGNSYIVDEKGMIISHRDKKMLGGMVDGAYKQKVLEPGNADFKYGNHLIMTRNISNLRWKLIADIPLGVIGSKSKDIRSFALIVAIALIVLSLAISVVLSRNLSQRLNYLLTQMQTSKVLSEFDKFNVADKKIGNSQGDEIDNLIAVYHNMIYKIEKLINDVYRAEIEETQAKLKALQAQINPHFLYNILDSAKACIDGNRMNEASKMIFYLGKFFRIALSRGKDKIFIKDEIEMIHHYLNLQKMCYGSTIDWKFHIEDEILQFQMVKFTLQPVVENAINHGIRNKRGQGCIHLRGYLREDDIIFEVEDDGAGISEDRLQELHELLNEGSQSPGKGYGLSNVNARLKLHYGKQYGIQLYSRIHQGTKAIISLPQEV